MMEVSVCLELEAFLYEVKFKLSHRRKEPQNRAHAIEVIALLGMRLSLRLLRLDLMHRDFLSVLSECPADQSGIGSRGAESYLYLLVDIRNR